MDRSRTTILPPKDLVSPSTSMATEPLLPRRFEDSSLGMAHPYRRLQRDGNRLANAQLLLALGDRLDAEHQPGPLLQAIDHGRGELSLSRDEIDACCQSAGAAVAIHGNPVADVDCRQCRLRHEEAHTRILRWQQRQDRSTGRDHLANPKIYLLD